MKASDHQTRLTRTQQEGPPPDRLSPHTLGIGQGGARGRQEGPPEGREAGACGPRQQTPGRAPASPVTGRETLAARLLSFALLWHWLGLRDVTSCTEGQGEEERRRRRQEQR